MLEHPAEPQPLWVVSCTAGSRRRCSWQKKPRRALSVTDRPANCWALKLFIQRSPLGHSAALVGNERQTGGGMNSPQGNTGSGGRGRSICLSAQSITHANTNLPGQQAHTGRLPVHPRNTHIHTQAHPDHTETAVTLVYTGRRHVHQHSWCVWRRNVAAHTQALS